MPFAEEHPDVDVATSPERGQPERRGPRTRKPRVVLKNPRAAADEGRNGHDDEATKDAGDKPQDDDNKAHSSADSAKPSSGGRGGKDGKDGKGSDDDDEKPAKPHSKKPLIILAIVVVIVAIIAFIFWFANRNKITTDDAYTDGNTVTMAPKVSGYVTELYINDNTRVKKGDLLLRIDPRDYLAAQAQAQAQLALARAQLDAANVALKIANIQYPAQFSAARAQQRAAEASLAQAQASFLRQHSVDQRATTQESVDAANSQQASAAANVDNAKAQVAVAGLVPQQIEQAQATVAQRVAQVKEAEANLAQANLNLSYTEVRAPCDGFVTKRTVQLGTYLTAGATMFLLVTPEVWITANYKESQLGRMRPGDAVDISVDAYDGLHLRGHIDSIQYGSGSRFSAFPTENATGNFVKIVQRVPVKIVIDSGLDPNTPLPLGLSVSPVVHLP